LEELPEEARVQALGALIGAGSRLDWWIGDRKQAGGGPDGSRRLDSP